MKKLISLISPCYNEGENLFELYRRVAQVIDIIEDYEFEYIIIDNASTDDSEIKLRLLASKDPRVKLIFNTRNFGHIRSPYWGLLQTKGSASIYLASDMQDPPELIPAFIDHWESGFKVVLATKPFSDTNALTHFIRKKYYNILDKISDVSIVKDTTGFGLYDRSVLDSIRKINDPYPYFRGLLDELGYKTKTLDFNQPRRMRGISKNNFYSLYDIAMLGMVSHSLIPIRLASFFGFLIGTVSIFSALIYFILKITNWNDFSVGIAPIVIGMFFMLGILMFFIGILGEYIGSIHTYLQNRPVVVERERVNFND
jgi:dolichol-phosphate mannosyltransferase